MPDDGAEKLILSLEVVVDDAVDMPSCSPIRATVVPPRTTGGEDCLKRSLDQVTAPDILDTGSRASATSGSRRGQKPSIFASFCSR